MKIEKGLAYLTAEEMAEFDRAAVAEFGIDELVLMENAGVAVANLAKQILKGTVAGKRICCIVGKGNNGGDGLVAARHLRNWGAEVSVLAAGGKADMKEIPSRQRAIVEKMGIPLSGPDGDLGSAELLVDAIFGYNLRGNPREPESGMILRANSSGIRTLAVDIPSGLDATTGEQGDPCVMAGTTLTLGLPKTGFLNPDARKVVGSLYVADISFPDILYERYRQKGGLFTKDPIVKVV